MTKARSPRSAGEVKTAIEASPDVFGMAMQICLVRGGKGKDWFYCPNPERQLAARRHTDLYCMKSIILSRLIFYTEKPDDSALSYNEFGFRKGR